MFIVSFLDIGNFLAFVSIVLLATSELISKDYGRTGILLDFDKTRIISLVLGLIFITFVILRLII